jgi:hypothetical protein
MEESAGKCRPFPFVERNARLMGESTFRRLPGDSEAFRPAVVTSRSHFSSSMLA